MQIPEKGEFIIEQEIIRAFGISIIEFEAVLYQKVLMISASHSLVSEKQFKKILNNMHAKGYISPTEFNKRKCWKREIILEDLESTYISPDEFEEVFRERSLIIPTTESSKPTKGKGIVSNSSTVAEEIRRTLLSSLRKGNEMDSSLTKDIQEHAKQMRKALSNSPEEFLRYVRSNLPILLEPMENILKHRGENVVLLGLRIVGTS